MKKLPFHQNEQGSAILIVLGILTLVLVLALVFVASSQNAHTIAQANADSGSAALMAEGAVARAEAAAYCIQNDPTNKPDDGTVNALEYKFQPFVGNFLTTNALDKLARGDFLSVKNGSTELEIQPILYTHDEDNKDEEDSSPFNLIASTKYGKFLDKATLENSTDSSSRFKALLFDAEDTRITYRNVLDSDNHVKTRYAFLMLAEGGKFNVNEIALASGGGDNYVPSVEDVDGTSVVVTNSASPGVQLEEDGKSTYAICGYDYTNGKIDELQDGGKYDEEKTLQYGLHPQELRVPADVIDLADKRKLGDANYPPKWFNYDNMLDNVWDEADTSDPMLDFWHLFAVNPPGSDDREVLFTGAEADADECSSDRPKINLARPGKTWNDISKDLNDNYLDATPAKSIKDYLQDKLSGALQDDVSNEEFFKDNSGNDITATVFANLVDFCDEDNAVTYEATVENPLETKQLKFDSTIDENTEKIAVKSCGNEMVPAIIGVGLEVESVARSATNSTNAYGQQQWSATGSGQATVHVRVVLQNYFNEDIKLPEKARVVVKGKIHPWFAGYNMNSGVQTYYLYGRSAPWEPLAGGYSDLDSDTYDFSSGAKKFVIDHTVSLSGTMEALEVDDTQIDFTATIDSDAQAVSGASGVIERAGLFVEITDILVMTSVTETLGGVPSDCLSDLAYVGGTSHAIRFTDNSTYLNFNTLFSDKGTHPVLWAVAQDPRCNHDHWKWFDDLESSGGDFGWTTSGEANTLSLNNMANHLRLAALKNIENACKSDGASDKDPEPDLDFELNGDKIKSTFSTAFIPNHPITSLWQLGAISRGLPGQTINLKKYGGPKGDHRKYEDGDAWLLDYFKLSELDDKASIRGKFNPNCFNASAYRYLFANIPANPDASEVEVYQPGRRASSAIRHNRYYDDWIDADSDTIEWEGSLFDFNEKLNAESTIYDEDTQAKKQSWSPVEAFYNFVQLKNTPEYEDNTGTTKKANDRMAESLIGCTAGLLSTRYEYFTVFAVGQAVKFIGQRSDTAADDYLPVDPNTDADFKAQLVNPVKIKVNTGSGTEEGWYSVLSTQVRLLTIERDCWFNTTRVVRTQLY